MSTSASALCWAKSRDGGREWLSVPQHLADAAAVAARLWDDWLPPAVRRRVEADLERPASARTLVRFLAGLHDLGKITPAFACQVPALLPAMAAAGLQVGGDVRLRRRELPHALAGGLALRRWLVESVDWTAPSADALAVIVAAHHGRPPSTLLECPADDLLGTGAWEQARLDTLKQTVLDLDATDELLKWRRQPPGEVAQVLLSAIVIVADWLASNAALFPLAEYGRGEDRAELAWRALRLPPPWRPAAPDLADPGFWRARFALPVGAGPRPVQTAAGALVRDATAPGLLVVEAPMGEGKTEAALAAAELLAARCGAGGVMIALPTMATSDAMFRRVLAWLDHLPRPAGIAWSTFLAHGKAQLNEDFRGLHPGRLDGVGVDEPGQAALAHEWLSGRKKGVLSTFVVGTIDQVLVGALRTRYLALRHLSLASKVVVLDEVHAADEYMSTYLTGVLAWLGAYGVPTVLLSATLPPGRRTELVAAYRDGRRPPRPGRTQSWRQAAGQPLPAPPTDAPAGYPLLTLVDGDRVVHQVVPASGRRAEVRIERQDDASLPQALGAALREGGTALVVCNTVTRAQRRAEELRPVFGPDVLLVHSRFLAADRQALEQQVRDALGPPEAARRPDRLVVVGTQVLEQSLDIDADLIATDLAPVDLVLQRLGRMHRHRRPVAARPFPVRAGRCLVTGVADWTAPVPEAVPGSQQVYGRAALLRSAAVLRPYLDGRPLRLPEDIAPLVRDAYAEPGGPDWPPEIALADVEAQLDRQSRRQRAGAFVLRRPNSGHASLLGWLDAGADEESPLGQAAVRDGLQGIEVLLLESAGDRLRIPPWLAAGDALLTDSPDGTLAQAALGCALRLPDWCTEAVLAASADGGLARPSGWSASRWLRGVLVLRAEPTPDGLRAQLGPLRCSYDRRAGLTVTRSRT